MPDERRQFRVLYRDFLLRLVDLELLSAGGDIQKLLGQFATILAAFGFTIAIFTFPALARSGLPFEKLIGPVRIEQEFLIATTMAIAGLFSVLAWNAVFPDRRDSLVLGLLPVRIRTIFLAKVAAIATALGVSIAAVNIFTGLCFPFLAIAPNAGPLGGLRSLGAHWLAMAAAGLFVFCALLALQGLAAQLLSYRLLLRFSSFLQLAAFFVNLGVYFLKPTFTSVAGPLHWLPSFWFCGLLQVLDGTTDAAFRTLALRAAWSLLLVFCVAAGTLALAYRRNIRRIIEQPDIAPADRSRPATRAGRFLAAKLLAKPIDRAILLFTARTIARSRQHRLLLAAYGGIGLAIALVYAKDLMYGYSGGLWDSLGVNRAASAHWNQANVPLLAGSLVLLCFAVIGVRATFSMPIALSANWIFRITAVHAPADCFAAVRRALLVLTAIPMWIVAACLFFSIWPAAQALEHVAILVVIGLLLVEISLYRFRKIPFACSYLPGKANINVRLGVYGLLFLFAVDRGVAIEYWAIGHFVGFLVLFGVLLSAALWARRRTAGFANLRGNRIQFEDVQTSQVFALDLRQDGAWSGDEASANAVDPHYGRKLAQSAAGPGPTAKATLIALNIVGKIAQSPGTEPLAAIPETPPMPVRSILEQLFRDIQSGVRIFRNSPAFSAVTVFLIALGIGANLTIYSIIHSILAKPAPVVRAGGLVTFGASIDGHVAEGGPFNSYPNYLDLAAQTGTMSALTASAAAPWLTLTLPDGSYEVRGEMVSENYFGTLGIPMARGRGFTEEESRGDGGLAAVIAYHLWQNQFHGAENIVGQPIIVNGHPMTVIGVTAQGFQGVGLVPRFEIGLPLAGFSRITGAGKRLLDRASREVTIIGRLAPHAGLSQARAEFATISERLEAAHPVENRGWALMLAPYSRTAFGPNSSPQAQRLMAGVGLAALLALLVVCANVASLMLGRSASREREMAIRLSLGASRLRLIRILAAEGMALSLAACLASWLLTSWVTRAIGKLMPPLESGNQLQLDLAPDGRVLGYAMALAGLSALAFTLAPAASGWRRQILPLLKAGEHSVTPGSFSLVSTLAVAQLALSVVLLIAGSLAYHSLFFINTSDLYFTRDHLLLAGLNTSGAATTSEQNIALLERIRQRLRTVPGVTSVSYSTAAPPHDHGWMDLPVRGLDSNQTSVTDGTIAGPGYMEALGVPMLIGRDISAADVAGGRATAVINQKLASALWPGQSALGQAIALNEGRQPIEIVGVVPNGAFSGVGKDGSFTGIGKAERPNFVFLSQPRNMAEPGGKTFLIRYTTDLNQIIPGVRAAVREVDGRVPVFSVRTMDAEFAEFIAPIRIVTMLIGIFAVSALILSSVGLFAVVAFHTARRTREFGIRTALGATSWQVVRAVLKQGLLLTGIGVAIGLTLAAAIAGPAGSLLFGVNPIDVTSYLLVSVLLAIVSLLACCIPALRASRVDPMLALRQD